MKKTNLLNREDMPLKCDSESGCYSIGRKDTMIRIEDLGEFSVRRCDYCETGFYAATDFWTAFEEFVAQIKDHACDTFPCCCHCRLIWAEVDFKTMSISERCCMRDKNKIGDHGYCDDFETVEMFKKKKAKMKKLKYKND